MFQNVNEIISNTGLSVSRVGNTMHKVYCCNGLSHLENMRNNFNILILLLLASLNLITLNAHTQANGMFSFQLCYIFLNIWMSEGNTPINFNF